MCNLLGDTYNYRTAIVKSKEYFYVGAGEGDTVLVGAGPGVAQEIFQIDNAPIRELVIGIVDHVDVPDEILVQYADLPT